MFNGAIIVVHEFKQTIPQLLSGAIYHLVHKKREFCSIDGHFTLLQRVAAIHVTFHSYNEEILWFGQLAASCPEILDQMQTDLSGGWNNDDEMVGQIYNARIYHNSFHTCSI